MAFCRSRKTGNCSDSSKNKRLPQKASETSPGSFPVPGSLPYAPAGGVARTLERVWHRRGKMFYYGLWMWLAGGGGADRNS